MGLFGRKTTAPAAPRRPAPTCTAPKTGHISGSEAEAQCPMHGNKAGMPRASALAGAADPARSHGTAAVGPEMKPDLVAAVDSSDAPSQKGLAQAWRAGSSLGLRDWSTSNRMAGEEVLSTITADEVNSCVALARRTLDRDPAQASDVEEEVAFRVAFSAVAAAQVRERISNRAYDRLTHAWRTAVGPLSDDDVPPAKIDWSVYEGCAPKSRPYGPKYGYPDDSGFGVGLAAGLLLGP